MKKIIPFFIIVVGCMTVIFFLFVLTERKEAAIQNGFYRTFFKNGVQKMDTYNLGYAGFGLAGIDDQTIYLSHINGLDLLITVDRSLQDTSLYQLYLDTLSTYISAGLNVKPPYFYLVDGYSPFIIGGRLEYLSVNFNVKEDPLYFLNAIPLSNSSYIAVHYDQKLGQTVLSKISNKNEIHTDHQLITKQLDGMFCTDGMLEEDEQTSTIVYAYFHRNEYVVMDTSLNLRYRGTTIDTVSHAQLKLNYIDGVPKLASPPKSINKQICASDGYLFVRSGLWADNEDRQVFKRNTVLDVYDLKKGKYKGSFYLPRLKKQEADTFKVFKDTLVALYGQYLVTYRLNLYNDVTVTSI